MLAWMPARPWYEFFARETLQRARGYLGDVQRVDGGLDGLGARVRGRRTYRLEVAFAGARMDPALGLVAERVDSFCSCPVGVRCKHAAAAILRWCLVAGDTRGLAALIAGGGRAIADPEDADEDGPEDGDEPDEPDQPPQAAAEEPPRLEAAEPVRGPQAQAIEGWFAQLRRLGAPTGDQRLTWHLQNHQGAWTVEVVSARRLKSGAFGVLKRHEVVEKTLRDPPPYATAGDIALLGRLAALRDHGGGWHSAPPLRRESGATGDLLAALLDTGRCFVGNFAHPLRRGDERSAHAAWEVEEGGQRLVLRDPGGHRLQIIPVDPPWWIEGPVAGPLAADLPPDALAAALRMPALPEALLGPALAELRRLAPALPEPAGAAPPVPPVPVFTRWRARMVRLPQRWPPERAAVPAALVHFRYGSALVSPTGARLVQGRDGRLVPRDYRAESARMQELAGLGLVPWQSQNLAAPDGPPPRSGLAVVHRATVEAAFADPAAELPGGVLAALAGSGWELAGSGAAAPAALAAATIEATWDEAADRDWFQLHLGVRVGDERLDLTALIARLLEQGEAGLAGLPRIEAEGRTWVCLGLPDGRVVRLPLDLLQRLIQHLVDLFAAPGGDGLRADAWQAAALAELEGVDAHAPARLRELAARLAALGSPGEAAPPPGLQAELRPYQRTGLDWLQRLAAAGTGGILADDMGLGKTVQAIAHLCAEQAAGRLDRPSLVVCPASVIGTWRRELARFAPGLRVAVHHGAERERDPARLAGFQVLITSYGTCLRDRELLAGVPLHLVICDEAQALKNAAAKTGDAVRGLDARLRLALTGTPMENHLGELHALMHWLVPGLLGSAKRFEAAFRKPIEREGDRARGALLRRRIAPFVLRRTKEAVAPELPPRTESVATVELEGGQRALYESVRLAMDARIRQVLAAKGLGKGRIEILDALLKLRQCCCDPRLVKGAKGATGAGSAKLAWLSDTLPELVEEGRRVLVFSQFTSLLDLIELDVLRPAKIRFLRLDGSTTGRDELVQRFQAGAAPVFLLSLKAGGTGLTLTAADTVILCDPWWNPAAEAQAADRAHRIGQDKPVFIWRLVAAGTVEERILDLQARKRALMDAVVDEDGQAVPAFAEEDLAALLAPLPE
ncbi:MAG: SNF2-related protein [Planctomycetes bacterium]|nr:SNF2-related protein [Planctomycetota bacterium]